VNDISVGSEESQEQALKMLACSGTLVNLVASSKKVSYRLMELSGERSIKGSSINRYEDVLTGIRLMEAGLINVKPMITHKYPLQEVNHGFKTLMDKPVPAR